MCFLVEIVDVFNVTFLWFAIKGWSMWGEYEKLLYQPQSQAYCIIAITDGWTTLLWHGFRFRMIFSLLSLIFQLFSILIGNEKAREIFWFWRRKFNFGYFYIHLLLVQFWLFWIFNEFLWIFGNCQDFVLKWFFRPFWVFPFSAITHVLESSWNG